MTVINFYIRIEDLLAFQKRYFAMDKKWRRMVGVCSYVFPLILLAVSFVFNSDPLGRGMASTIVAVAVAVVWVILMPRYLNSSALRRARKSLEQLGEGNFFGEREMIFTSEGIRSGTAAGATDQRTWDSITKWEDMGGYYYLYVSDTSAFIIPKDRIGESKALELERLFEQHLPGKKA